MSNQKNDTIRIVKGSERFAGSTDQDIQLQVNFEGSEKNYVEKDRSIFVYHNSSMMKDKLVIN